MNNRVPMNRTTLHRAAQAGFTKITQLLIDCGADVDALDDKGQTPLFFAARHGRLVALKLLLKICADCETSSRTGRTALAIARRSKKADAARIVRALQTRK